MRPNGDPSIPRCVSVCQKCGALSGKENLMFCKSDGGIELYDMGLHASEGALACLLCGMFAEQ